jgi:tetraprenyl-beta-curcumene synthase
LRPGASPAISDPRWPDVPRTVAEVFRRPSRIRRLVALGPAGWLHLARFLRVIIPIATARLRELRERAQAIPDPRLRAEALASIDGKAYHVQGGCVLATFLPSAEAEKYVAIVAPLESIYDYLDNLCDRLEGVTPQAFATLHEALLDALDASRPIGDYYRDGPERDDGGYLRDLVEETRRRIAGLPGFMRVAAHAREAARFYAELQYAKHLAPALRVSACESFYERNRARFPDLFWWEFAAAAGSSMPVFAMIFLAFAEGVRRSEIDATYRAYFPNLSAVHILLDYFIDQAEDREHAELNFVACYGSPDEAVARVRTLVKRAAQGLRRLPRAPAHRFALRAMCTFYLTHPKVFEQHLDRESRAMLAALP